MTVLLHINGTRHLLRDTDVDFLNQEINKYKELNLGIAYDGMRIEL
jgi:hypothetical protein